MNKTEYNTIHQWLKRHYIKTGVCDICKQPTKTEWSTKTGKYHRHNRLEWQEACKPCHYKYDVEVLGRPTMQEAGRLGKGIPRPGAGFASMSKEKLHQVSVRGGLAKARKY